MKLDHLGEALVTTAAFTVFGLAIFTLAFWVMGKLSPFSLRKEIEEDHNTALAIVFASVIIGIAIIIGMAIQG
jgi:putative membrane protein